ncbi:MAG: ATP-binding protein [Spirochaetota bacterium]
MKKSLLTILPRTNGEFDPSSDQDRIARRTFELLLLGLTGVLVAFSLFRFLEEEIYAATTDLALAGLFAASYIANAHGRTRTALVLSLVVAGFLLHAHLFVLIVFDLAGGVLTPTLTMMSMANVLLVAYMMQGRAVLLAAALYGVGFNAAEIVLRLALHEIDPVYLANTILFLSLGIVLAFALSRYKQALIRARDEAEAATQAKSVFLSNMSHEIRTPMTGIDGFLRILEEGETSPERRRYFSLARNASSSLLGIIDDILELSKVEDGSYRFRTVDFSPRTILDEAAEVLSVNAAEKGLDLSVEVDEEVPRFVHGDPDRLKQVLFNVIGNAVKYTDEGSVRVRSRVEQRVDEQVTLLTEVEDTGVGMSQEEQDIIFDAFSQVDASYAKKHKGTGLGLALSRRLCRSMGGDIWCESTKGRGSTFYFTVRLTTPEGPQRSQEEGKVQCSPKSYSILVAEDDRINQIVIRKQLEGAGHQVEVVDDGHALLEVVESVRPDIVLMDVQMPGLDGVETTRRLRSEMPPAVAATPVIALTAYVSDEDRRRFLEAGMNAHVMKPIDIDTLCETMHRLVEEDSPETGAVPE